MTDPRWAVGKVYRKEVKTEHNKTCSKCKQTKSKSEFHKATVAKDGYSSWCKQCKHVWKRTTNVGIAYKRRSKERWRKNNLEKANAHHIVCRAIESGELKREPCSVCGNNTDIHGHHENYDKPLDVIWLCRDCHRALHDEKEREVSEKMADVKRKAVVTKKVVAKKAPIKKAVAKKK